MVVVRSLTGVRLSYPANTAYRAPGLKFGFTGEQVAITFGPLTTDRTLISYRIDGQDWQFTNVTTNATHLLISMYSYGFLRIREFELCL